MVFEWLFLWRFERELGGVALEALLLIHRRRSVNADPQGPGDEEQVEHERQGQKDRDEMLPHAAARRQRGYRHVREPSPRSRRKAGAGSNRSGRKLASFGCRGAGRASEGLRPIEKPSQLANATAAAMLPH